MTTNALTGQVINYKGQNVPLQYDKQKSEYYVTVNGIRYEVDWNCILNSKAAEVKEDIQEQADNHQKWIAHYQSMIESAKEQYSNATEAIKNAKNYMAKLMSGEDSGDYKNLDSTKQKEYLAYQQEISDGKRTKRMASSDILFAANQTLSELSYQNTCNMQASLCDHIMA